MNTPILSRRAVLAAFSVPAVHVLTGGSRAALAQTGASGDVCFLTPQSMEGPYYVDPKLVRAEIAEGRAGVPLRLAMRVIDGATCKPTERARVDIWHSDAQGIYSGYDGQGDRQNVSTVGQKFLRGTQFTDSEGAVSFETIYPGWYSGRATHVHFKVFLADRNVLTGQMYFPEKVNESSYANIPAYAGRSRRRTANANDWLAKGDTRQLGLAAVKEERDRYAASLTIGVDRSGAAGGARRSRG
jgi:protocatechuate 3,4-dioxygenase beta subunit